MAIETVSEIHSEVANIIQDSSFDINDTISYINKGLKEISGRVLLPDLLETETTIETVVDTAYASLPDDFQRNLHYCYSDTNSMKINIYPDVRLLYREFSRLDLTGRVVGVAVKGRSLYYQRIPSAAETLRLHYYSSAPILTLATESPEGLPEYLVRPLLVNYVAKEMYKLWEDGIEGQKINTMYYEAKFLEAMSILNNDIGPEAREPQYIQDDLNLESYL